MSLTLVLGPTRDEEWWRHSLFAAAVSLLLSHIAFPVFAQSNYASLTGTVYDPQHQAINT